MSWIESKIEAMVWQAVQDTFWRLVGGIDWRVAAFLIVAVAIVFRVLGPVISRMGKVALCVGVALLAGGLGLWMMRPPAPPPPAPVIVKRPIEFDPPDVDLTGVGEAGKAIGAGIGDAAKTLVDAVSEIELPEVELPKLPEPDPAELARAEAERLKAEIRLKELAAQERKAVALAIRRARNERAKMMINGYIARGMQQAGAQQAAERAELQRMWNFMTMPRGGVTLPPGMVRGR